LAGAFGQGGARRAERLESKILMVRQPLGRYELSCVAGPGGDDVQPISHVSGAGGGGTSHHGQWRAAHRHSAPKEGPTPSGGDPVLRHTAAPAPLFIPWTPPGTPAYVSASSSHLSSSSSSSCLQVAAEQQQGRKGCRGRPTSTSTSCARSRATTTSPPPPSSATTAPSGPRAPHSRWSAPSPFVRSFLILSGHRRPDRSRMADTHGSP
jgi:hypothetical protein